MAIDAGANVVLREDKPITEYFAAADVYVMPVNDPIPRDFGGFGIAPMEALAQNTPVISPNIVHFESDANVYLLGHNLNNHSIENAIKDMLYNEKKYSTRAIIKYYLDIY